MAASNYYNNIGGGGGDVFIDKCVHLCAKCKNVYVQTMHTPLYVYSQFTPLHMAASKAHIDVAKELVQVCVCLCVCVCTYIYIRM